MLASSGILRPPMEPGPISGAPGSIGPGTCSVLGVVPGTRSVPVVGVLSAKSRWASSARILSSSLTRRKKMASSKNRADMVVPRAFAILSAVPIVTFLSPRSTELT